MELPTDSNALTRSSEVLAHGWRVPAWGVVSAAVARGTEENVVKQEQAKGEVRPDGPGDDTAPVKPETDKH